MEIKGRKIRLGYKLTLHKEKGEKVLLFRQVKSKIISLIKANDCKMSIRVKYDKGLYNETVGSFSSFSRCGS